jgi:hypothetical protein
VTGRRARGLAAGTLVALAAGVVAWAHGYGPVGGLKALLAGAIAVAVGWFAVTLPGITVRGATIGGLFVAAGFSTWTFTNHPLGTWAVLAVTGLVTAVWSRPWLANLRTLPRLGTAWLGLAYWLLGIVGAVLSAHFGVALQRVAYAGVFTLAALAVVVAVRGPAPGRGAPAGGLAAGATGWPARGDPSVGMVAAILVGLAALLLAGSATLFDAVHAIPNHNLSTVLMRDRFWGGPGLYFHPNSIAGLAVLAVIRIGPDRAFAVWQRAAALVVAAGFLYLCDSRIGFVFAAAALLVYAVLLLARRRPADLPEYRRRWLAIAVPAGLLALVLVLSGGSGFLFRSRFGGEDATSGRLDTWKQVVRDLRADGPAEQLFGDAKTSRAVVVRAGSDRPLNTDNAAVGALRRGGVLGLLAFLFGLGLLLWHVLRALRRRAPPAAGGPPDRELPDRELPGGVLPVRAWFVVAAIAAVPTIATEDWLLGGTNGVIWLVLLAGEAALLWVPVAAPTRPEPAGAAPWRRGS